MKRIAIIGGGAAGMIAAYTCATMGASVTLYEKNEKLGRKLRITGKGRCNLTNNCDNRTLMQNVLRNPRFLYSALAHFSAQDTMRLFGELGVPLKTERGNRVFPVSDKATDVVDALWSALRRTGVTILHDTVTAVRAKDGTVHSVHTRTTQKNYDAVIVATGGLSYPLTGSTGDGYRFAQELGHTIVPVKPSLVPVEMVENTCAQMMGLSLKNVCLTLLDTQTQKKLFCEQGELIFTHFGMSGPLVLSASTHMQQAPYSRYRILLDLKPALDSAMLDARLQRELTEQSNRNYSHILEALLPKKMIEPFVAQTGIAPDRKGHSITKQERWRIGALCKEWAFSVKGLRPVAEAIVSAGGVSVAEVNPKTMESKLVKNLYFAGELLDVDAYTGGFNLQLAFSTGYTAAIAAATEEESI